MIGEDQPCDGLPEGLLESGELLGEHADGGRALTRQTQRRPGRGGGTTGWRTAYEEPWDAEPGPEG